jgi:hypothetical protein
MCQFSTVDEREALEVLYGICSTVLAFGQANSDLTEKDCSDGVRLELLVNDMRITIETGLDVFAEVEATKAIKKAAN